MSNECIQVVVRMRPFNRKEKEEGRLGIVEMDMELNQVAIKNPDHPDAPPKAFTFDSVYDGSTQQRAFYEESCFGLVENVLVGFNGTIFAYGQTGCGKTFTMQGPNDPPEMRGVIPNSFSHIFDQVTASKDVEYLVRCSYLEIYNEVIKDLLGDQKNPLKCDLKEDPQKGIIVSNLTDVVVKTEADMDYMLNKGLANRTVGSTLMNAESSRSHSIFTIVVEMNNRDENGKDHIRAGKLNLVDLAGSERQKKTGASGDRLKEGSKINLSLSALGNVISALSDGGGKHIPYRDSKLTRLLQDSLGGNTKTLMVAAMSPADYNYDETLSTLRYANRAKSIKNKPKINEDPKDAMIREFKEEIERLRKMLEMQAAGALAGQLSTQLPPPSKSQTVGSDEEGSPQEEQRRATEPVSAPSVDMKPEALDFAALVTEGGGEALRITPKKEKSPRKKSPRVKVEKEIVEVQVEVEKIPEEHLHRQRQLEEYSQAVEEERDYFGEQLKEMQNEVDIERQKRDELTQRLLQLQSKLVGRSMSIEIPPEIASGGRDVPELVLPTERQVKEQQAAQARLNERKAKARRKEESKKKAQNDRLVRDNTDLENDLQQTIAGAQDSMEKKIAKIRKKFEKKLMIARSEIDDLHQEFEIEREEMLESIRESSRDTELFRQICLALLDEKKLRQIVDKCQYDEDAEEWIIPYLKPKETELKLPGLNSARRIADEKDRDPSLSSRPGSGVSGNADGKTSARPSSREYASEHKQKGSNTTPTISLPPHAPSKPPMPRSARRDKKKSRSADVRQDLPDAQDEGGTGETAGSIDEWGFAADNSAPAPARKQKVAEPPDDMEYDPTLVLNHIGGAVGDRQSSRHGSRQKNRSSNGKRKKSSAAMGSETETITSDKGFAASCSPRGYSNGVSFPQL